MSGKVESTEKHVMLGVLVSGGMALGLAFGLELLGFVGGLNVWLLEVLKRSRLAEPAASLGGVCVWVTAGLMAFLLALAMLTVVAGWRRFLLWMVTVVLTIFWAPVLYIAAQKPEVGVALVAVFWSGFCAMVYGSNHAMPVDRVESLKKKGGQVGEG